MSIDVKKAKIKNSLFLTYGYTQLVGDRNQTINVPKDDAPFHEDLGEAFKKCAPHFALLTESVSADDLTLDDNGEVVFKPGVNVMVYHAGTEKEYTAPKFFVDGFQVTGPEDEESVSLSGSRRLSTNKTINFDSPMTEYHTIDYPYWSQLVDLIELLKSEVFEFMNGKKAEDNQLDMFATPEEDDANIEFEVNPAGDTSEEE